MAEGYIKLFRKITEHGLWQEKPFSKGQAWVDLIMMANHKPAKVILGNELCDVSQGELITSTVKLSKRWGWSRHKVMDFLDLLEKDTMIEQKRDSKRTWLKLCNYGVFQSDTTSTGHRKDTKRTSKGHQKDTNKNDKNDKNEKNDKNNNPPIIPPKKSYAEFVTMTNDEHEKLLATYGQEMTDRMIEILDNYKGSNGKKYTSDYRTILNWVVKRAKEEGYKPKPPSKYRDEWGID